MAKSHSFAVTGSGRDAAYSTAGSLQEKKVRPLLTVSATIMFGSMCWASATHFLRVDKTIPAATKVVAATSITGYLCLMYSLALSATSIPMVGGAAGVAFFVLSFIILLWARNETGKGRLSIAFSSDLPRIIILTGPYRFVRHPFYTSYLVFWIGASFATWPNFLIIAMTFAFLLMYNRAAEQEERKFASSSFAQAYGAYSKTTGRFVPIGWPVQ